MELFPTEFSHPSEPPGDDHDALSVGVDDHTHQHQHHLDEHSHAHAHAHEHDHAQAVHTPTDLGDGVEVDATGIPLRGKAATQGMSLAQKKERQKQQNRRAAERSRNKKREELTALEMTVNNIQDENARLRARLATLLSAKPGDAAPPQPSDVEPASAIPTGINYANLARLQAELTAAKQTLLERELELGQAQGVASPHSDELRASLLASGSTLQNMQSEVKALHSVISHLRVERDNLARQRDILSRELDARRTMRDAVSDTPPGSAGSRAPGVERALLDLRGMVDGVIKSWDQASVACLHVRFSEADRQSSMLPARRSEGFEPETQEQ